MAIKKTIIELEKKADAEKEALRTKLFPLVGKVFPGLTVESFGEAVFFNGAQSSRMYLYTQDRDPVGFHTFSHHLYKGDTIVFRVFSCLTEQAKGDNTLENAGFVEILRTRVLHPFKRIIFFTCYVNPVPYYVMMKNFHEAYPHYEKELPRDKRLLLYDLADHFHLAKVPGRMPLVRSTPAIGTPDPAEIERTERSDKPAIVKFLEWCPAYVEGEGLVTMAPVTWSNAFRSLFKKLSAV